MDYGEQVFAFRADNIDEEEFRFLDEKQVCYELGIEKLKDAKETFVRAAPPDSDWDYQVQLGFCEPLDEKRNEVVMFYLGTTEKVFPNTETNTESDESSEPISHNTINSFSKSNNRFTRWSQKAKLRKRNNRTPTKTNNLSTKTLQLTPLSKIQKWSVVSLSSSKKISPYLSQDEEYTAIPKDNWKIENDDSKTESKVVNGRLF